MSKLALLIPFLFLNACTSYMIKADCERTDWYQYGRSAAMEGRRLSGDRKVRQCEEVDGRVDAVALDHGFKEGMSNYCQPETVLMNGKQGQFFNEDMCEQTVRLRREHTAGVRIYCAKGNAFSAGAAGKKYNGICPKDLESAFLPEFNRGRKNFLNATIASNESALNDLQVSISQLQGSRFMYQSQLMSLPPEMVGQTVIVVDPISGQQTVQAAPIDYSISARRQHLEAGISSVDSQIFEKQRQAEKLRAANRDLRVEMTLL